MFLFELVDVVVGYVVFWCFWCCGVGLDGLLMNWLCWFWCIWGCLVFVGIWFLFWCFDGFGFDVDGLCFGGFLVLCCIWRSWFGSVWFNCCILVCSFINCINWLVLVIGLFWYLMEKVMCFLFVVRLFMVCFNFRVCVLVNVLVVVLFVDICLGIFFVVFWFCLYVVFNFDVFMFFFWCMVLSFFFEMLCILYFDGKNYL